MKRRDFLKDAAIASGMVAAFPLRSAAVSMRAASPAISAVVYDARYADCELFADTLIARAVAAFPTNGDLARVWYGVLREHLEQVPGPVAGMTTDSDWGVSRGCGRESGLKVAYEASHDSRKPGIISHSLRGDGTEANVYGALLAESESWAAAIANALNRPRATEQTAVSAVRFPWVATLRSVGSRGYLTSWLLRPYDR